MSATVSVIPIFQSIWISFYQWDGLSAKIWIGLGNYVELFHDPAFYTSLKNNIIWLILYMLAVPAGLAIAIFLNQNVIGIRLYKSLFFFPFVISQVVVGLIFSWFYAPNIGIFPQITEALGLGKIAVLADARYVTYGIIAAGLWPQIAYCMILYLTGLNNVSPDQVEAGRLDGARGWRMLWHVILPQVFRLVLPALGNQYIGLTKNTSVVLFIGVADLVFQAQQIEATTFRAFEAFTAVIVIFATLCLTEAAVLSFLSNRGTGRRSVTLGWRLRPTPSLLEQPE